MASHLTRRTFVTGVGTVAATLVVVPRSRAGDAVRIVTGLRATLQSLGWIGAEAGIFQRLGVDVAFPRPEAGGPEAERGLTRGEWDVAETGSSPIIQGALAGRDGVILLVPTRTATGGTVLARPGITAPAQLAGTRIGVLTETGQTTIGLRAALRALGVGPATLVPLGTFARIYAALRAGEIDAGALAFDYRFVGPRHGLTVLEMPATGFQSAVVASSRRFIAAHRDVVARVVRGYVETIHFFKTRRAEAVPLLQRFLRFEDRGAVDAAWEYYAEAFQRIPRTSPTAIRALLDELAQSNPAARGVSASAFVDTSFLDGLESSGFVKTLYGN